MIKERLAALRAKMQEAGIDVYVVPSGDFHCSEYVSAYFRAVCFISGFTGSAGTVVVTQDEALLWTDGRYFLQAEHQIEGTGFTLMRMAVAGVPTVAEYLAQTLADGQVLGFDGRIVSLKLAEEWRGKLGEKQVRFEAGRDLIGEIWTDRPAQEFHGAWLLDEKYTGESAAAKLARVREAMQEKNAGAFILSAMDDIAWLLNLRGADVPNNPVVFAFAYVDKVQALLFVKEEAISAEVKAALAAQGVEIRPYEAFWGLETPEGTPVLLDKAKTAYTVAARVRDAVAAVNPTTLMKCVKNPTEQEALRESHRKDGVAMVKWLYWLEHHPDREALSEIDVSDYLETCRREAGAFDLSFNTIAAMGPNAAMMHYSATPEAFAMLENKGMLLVDSGGQYPDGTTDITRTIAMGPLTEEERLHYTATLRSMLRLSSAKFLEGTTCYFLDILARGPIWDMGLDYRCGTGHGVGFCLNVHEGPNGFRWTKPADMDGLVTLKPGMVTTDEPGVYMDGRYGIRIENELLCVDAETTEYGHYLRFETLTLCPIDLRPVIPELLTVYEKIALNEYHAMVYERLRDGLTAEEAAWLREVTQAI
ncbi:MAG: aminopeptidase P family protein [Lachnospiraceae bacterium]|nr:aminopeptidase P family protein [Lachnospiraceae bacterium]